MNSILTFCYLLYASDYTRVLNVFLKILTWLAAILEKFFNG